MEGWIQTFTGKAIDPMNPDPKKVVVEDIAHALALVNRFTGHTSNPRSVAAHSYDVSTLLERRGFDPSTQLIGLLHDASEAYLCDIAAPVKQHPAFAEYRAAEKQLQLVIYLGLGVEEPAAKANPIAVKQADVDMLIAERHIFLGPGPWNPPLAPGDVMVTRDGDHHIHWSDWEEQFLARYVRLRSRIAAGMAR